MSNRHWYLFSYDIREPRRWRQVYKIVNGYGERLQYSLFRCYLTATQMEHARNQLEQKIADEDDLLIIRLSPLCKIIERTSNQSWTEPPPKYDVI